jgi:outer membrane protein assembly factor BamB
MIGVDCATGEVLWETSNPGDWKMSHSSIMPYEFGGRKMFVYSASGGIAGIAADGPDVGTILWQTSQWNHPVVAASPVCMPDGKIFITAGYGAGSMLLQLSENNGAFAVEVLQSFRPGEGLSSEQQTPVLVDGHMFGVLPKDARTLRNQMVCVKPDDPTQIVWASGSTARFGLGPYIVADDKFFLLDDDATLVIIQKSTRGYIELDKVKLFDGHDAWAPLAIADGYMVLRDADRVICIDLRR